MNFVSVNQVQGLTAYTTPGRSGSSARLSHSLTLQPCVIPLILVSRNLRVPCYCTFPQKGTFIESPSLYRANAQRPRASCISIVRTWLACSHAACSVIIIVSPQSDHNISFCNVKQYSAIQNTRDTTRSERLDVPTREVHIYFALVWGDIIFDPQPGQRWEFAEWIYLPCRRVPKRDLLGPQHGFDSWVAL